MNQPVLVQNHNGDPKWVPGTILSRLGSRNYEVLVDGKVWKRHINQLLKKCELTKVDEKQPDNDDLMDFELQFPIDEPDTSTNEPDTSASQSWYPTRTRQPPDRLTYN